MRLAGGGLRPGRSACFDTGYVDPSAFTYVAVAKPLSQASQANQNAMVSNFGDTDTISSSLYQNAAATACVRAAKAAGALVGAGSDAAVSSPDYTKFNIFDGRVDPAGSGAIKVGWSKDGVRTAGTQVTITGRTPSSRTLRIGGNCSTATVTGSREIAAVAIWNRAISDAELRTVLAELRAFYTPLGLANL